MTSHKEITVDEQLKHDSAADTAVTDDRVGLVAYEMQLLQGEPHCRTAAGPMIVLIGWDAPRILAKMDDMAAGTKVVFGWDGAQTEEGADRFWSLRLLTHLRIADYQAGEIQVVD